MPPSLSDGGLRSAVVLREAFPGLPGLVQRLSPREREVLGLIAEGRTNAGLAKQLFISEAAVNKHIGNIFDKLDLPVDTDGHRRVLAVLAFLRA
ncbi:hypothetical protein AQI94_37515 [Streptomyces pseudovenezuelae]|uniref:HTH luxR-type domain-containing protein n=1 Tax=Streptomyces pseudovenezuelae TaxID=67350 RepID=A0A101MYC7_9ACTN|nr:hypothetical protein AQI94_37515 [Streptomyces pseudovenezuelae]